MFWKNTAWSWDGAVGHGHHDDDDDDNDDGGYLLAVDLRKTPEPLEPQLKPTRDSKDGTTGTAARLWTSGFAQNLDSINANHSSQQDVGSSSTQQRRVSQMTQKPGTPVLVFNGVQTCWRHIPVHQTSPTKLAPRLTTGDRFRH